MTRAGTLVFVVALGLTSPRAAPAAEGPSGASAASARRLPAPEHRTAPPPVAGSSVLTDPRSGIDWERRVLFCGGVAPPTLAEESENVAVTRLRTQRAALASAVGACMNELRTVTVAPGVAAGELFDGDAALVRDVEQAIRHAPVADPPRLFADGGAAIRLAVPLDGPVGDLLLAAADRLRSRRPR